MALFITMMISVAVVEAATEITTLPRTITTQGSYIINKNLTSTSNGIVVKVNNVTIDLNGYNIAGNNTGTYYGVYIQGRSNVEIRNGTIRNFGSHGIYEESSSGNSHRVINVRVMNNKGYGIQLDGSNHMVKDCTASNNNGDLGIYAGSGSTVIGNTAYDNGKSGILAGYGSTVIGNTAYSNGLNGIITDTGCTVKNNTAVNNQSVGISINTYNLVDGNTAYDNCLSGGVCTNMRSCPTCVFGDNVQ
jgi:parallel beta-helix repeat protein